MADVFDVTGKVKFEADLQSADKAGKEAAKSASKGFSGEFAKEAKSIRVGIDKTISQNGFREIPDSISKRLKKQRLSNRYTDALQRNAERMSSISERLNQQNMYKSLWEKLDNGGTVYSHNNVAKGNTLGMMFDVALNKTKALLPLIEKITQSLKPLKTFLQRLGRIAVYRAIRTLLKEIVQSLKEGVNNLYQWSKLRSDALGNNFAKSMDRISTALLTVKNSIATVVAPIIEALAPAIERVAEGFQKASESLAQFFATILGTGSYLKAIKYNLAYASSVKAVQNALMGFDELNVLNGNDLSATITDYSKLFESVTLTDDLKNQIATKMVDIGAKVSAVPLALGAILALTGVNIPLGIGLMAVGAVGLAKTVTSTWDALDEDMQTAIGSIVSILSTGSLAVGAVLAFSGANIPLGIGLMAAGAIGLVTLAKLDWENTSNKVRDSISKITVVTSSLLLGVGCLLAFTGVNVPLGVGMILAGSSGLATAATINWNTIKDELSKAWEGIKKWFNQDVAPKFTSEYWESKGKTLAQGLVQGIITGWNEKSNSLGDGLLGKLLKGTIQVTNFLNTGVGGLVTNKSNAPTLTTTSNTTNEDYLLKKFKQADRLAGGGIPDVGSLFWAGENGAELIAQVGGHSTVYNEEQLGESLAYANESVVNAINTLIGVVRSKSNNVTISASDIRKAVNQSSMRVGV